MRHKIVLSSFIFALLSPAPAALAQNECDPVGVDPSVNGPLPDDYECSQSPYADGITYDSDGDLTLTKTASDFTPVAGDGVSLTGNDADAVTWDSSIGGLRAGSGMTGALIGVTTDAGDIDITTLRVFTGFGGGATHGILATSTSGDISIDVLENSSVTQSGSEAIVAAFTSGDIDISLSGDMRAYQRVILAETSGAGDITLNLAGDAFANTLGEAVIQTTADSGATNINLTGGEVYVRDGFDKDPGALLIRASSASTSPSMAVNVQNSGAKMTGRVDFSGVTAGGVTFTHSGTGLWQAAGDSVFGAGNDTLNFLSEAPPHVGGNVLAEGGSIDFGAGDDTLNIVSSFEIGSPDHFGTELGGSQGLGATLAFGTGTDAIDNSGAFSIDGPISATGLEAFNNSGTVHLGAINPQFGYPRFGDLDTNDVLTMPGTTFTGTGQSRLIMAIHFDGSQQKSCAAPTGAGDCLYLLGGTTAGSTLVNLINAGDAATLSRFDPVGVAIVDVNGGTSAAGHFVLDPDSTGYVDDALYGPAIERPGLFRYVLQYDADNQRHVMAGLPRSEVFEYAALGSAVHSIWHMTSEAITDRRNDLRADQEGAVWMRATTDHARRDLTNRLENYGQTYTMDHGYKLDAEALIGGIDMVSGHNGTVDYVAGVQLGYTRSQMVLETGTSAKLSGAVAGVYGSLWSDRFFIDGTVNTNFLALDNNSPLGRTTTRLESLGVHVEAGLRISLPENFYAEPLTTLSHVNTIFEEISVEGGEILPDDAKSTRSAFGLRLGREWSGETLNGSYFVTGRAWNVHEGGGDGFIANPGDELTYSDDFSGSFTQLEAGLNLHNEADTMSGYVSLGSKSKDDYRSNNLSAGVRLRWW